MVTFSLFQTSLGACGIAWSGNLVAATALPEESDTRTAGRLRSRTGATEGRPPPAIGRAIAAITSLLEGERTDLSFIEGLWSLSDSIREVSINSRFAS